MFRYKSKFRWEKFQWIFVIYDYDSFGYGHRVDTERQAIVYRHGGQQATSCLANGGYAFKYESRYSRAIFQIIIPDSIDRASEFVGIEKGKFAV